MIPNDTSLDFREDHWVGRFRAMASPCEVLIDIDDEATARDLLERARREALRIEHKFSRYRDDNIIHAINHSGGKAVEVDEETSALLDYADQCYRISEGRFDITSGILREVWKFDGSDRIPDAKSVKRLRARIGWPRVKWQRPVIELPADMEIDLGGIGKEYAVDRTAQLLHEVQPISVLVNFGGDLFANVPRRGGRGWIVGVEDPGSIEQGQQAMLQSAAKEEFELVHGGIATSGDTRRYLLKDGVRYSHILDPRTGWPVRNAPHSVTVLANTCTEAGILATLAMLHGKEAEAFLQQQGVTYWSLR